LAIGSPTRKRIKSILDTKLDQQPELFTTPAVQPSVSPPAPHANVRGAGFFRSLITDELTPTGDTEPCSSNPPSIH
jgi:hypothetical protein